MKGLLTITARDFADAVVDTRLDLRVTDITEENAGSVRRKLRDLYGDEAPEITGSDVFVPGNDSLFKTRYSDGDLVHVMKRLTAEDGCPWDRAQTHESIRINAVEEAYELCEAIDNRDTENIREETGDLLLQAIFHADMAERGGEFTRLDVVDALVRKLVTRHTHIFGADKATDPADALRHWEAAKAVEKHASSLEEQLARIPGSFPALLYAQKVIKKLVKAGMESAEPATADDLLAVVRGCVAGGVDAEVELKRAVRALAESFTAKADKS